MGHGPIVVQPQDLTDMVRRILCIPGGANLVTSGHAAARMILPSRANSMWAGGGPASPDAVFSYVSAEQRVLRDHPLRAIRALVDEVLRDMSRKVDGLYARVGRPSIPPERLLRAQLLQIFYSIRSERLLMQQLDYNLLFRWFVGMDMDEPIWALTVVSKNRDRLLNQEIAHPSSPSLRAVRSLPVVTDGLRRPFSAVAHGPLDDDFPRAVGSHELHQMRLRFPLPERHVIRRELVDGPPRDSVVVVDVARARVLLTVENLETGPIAIVVRDASTLHVFDVDVTTPITRRGLSNEGY